MAEHPDDAAESLPLRHPRALHRVVLWLAVFCACWLTVSAPAFAF